MKREITCIRTGDDEYEDCRCITKLGYVDPMTGRQKLVTPDRVFEDIVENGTRYYITVTAGQRADLIPVDRDDKQYVRAERKRDTPQDPLLKQPSC